MPSSPMKKEAFDVLETIGEESILALVSSGVTVTAIAQRLGIHRPAVSTWLNKNERYERYQLARKEGANALAEQALHLADSATNRDVNAKKLQVDMRRWLAEKFNPETFGQKAQLGVHLTAGEMHLDALRNRNKPITDS